MEGDVANIPEMVKLAKQYNASVMIDEAHGIGVFGKGGRGVVDHYGLTMMSISSWATFLQVVCVAWRIYRYRQEDNQLPAHHSRSYIFTASITPASTAH